MAELVELKKQLKQWETGFVAEHGKKPGRTDIDGAPAEIQDAYSKYSKLKKEQGRPEGKPIEAVSDRRQSTSPGARKPALPVSTASDTKPENQTDEIQKESEDQSSGIQKEAETGGEAQNEVWGTAFNRKNVKPEQAKDETVEKKPAAPAFLRNLSDKMFKKSMMLGPKKPINTTPQWKKPDTPHPWKVLTRNPFGEPLPSPLLSESFGDGPEKMTSEPGSTDSNGHGHGGGDGNGSFGDGNMVGKSSGMGSSNISRSEEISYTPKSSTSVFAKAMKVTKISNTKAARSDDTSLYLGKFQSNKPRQKVLPKGLSALVSKHKEQTESGWEPEYDEVDGECVREESEDREPEDDADTGKHSWDMPVKSLIIDDMIKSRKPVSKPKSKATESTKNTSVKESKHENALSDLSVNTEMNEEQVKKKSAFDFDDRDVDIDDHGESPKEDKVTVAKKPRSTRGRTAKPKIPKELQSDHEEEEARSPVKKPTASRKRKPVIEDSPDSGGGNNSDGAIRSDSETEGGAKGKKRKAKGGKPAAKKRKTQAAGGTEVQDDEAGGGVTNKPVKRAAPRAKAVSNDNFVRLNMKVKTYKRKGRAMTGPQYKRKMWKEKMSARSKSYSDACFKCGQSGHWANKCPGGGSQSASRYEKEPVQDEDFPSMQEAVQIARGVKPEQALGARQPQTKKEAPRTPKPRTTEAASGEPDPNLPDDDNNSDDDTGGDLELDLQAEVVRSRQEPALAPAAMKPLIECGAEESLPETPDFVMQGLKKFGYDTFRPGQEAAIMRILCGLSTLVVLSTGGGKSLCYQLPAYLYSRASSCFTLVISPLVSLMEDQVTGLPPGINGVCMHTNMTAAQREKVLGAVKDGKAQFLLVSPEAVAGGSMTLITAMATLPPVAFACIDESHCLSEWSHNFRPSYLRLCKVLQEKLGIQCFLGLTATATLSTAADVSRHLKITDVERAMVRGSPVPKNLFLSVSRDENREQALVGLLQGERFCKLDSIIIYCTRRDQTDKVATIIRTCLNKGPPLQAAGKGRNKKGPKLEWDAESYHAGLTPAARKRVQNAFMSGRLRVVVATVAFGMGLDKSDVRGVLHYNMPKSFESYVQEIGRAGRDGEPAQCHLFLDPEGKDLCELRRHTFANTVDYRTLKKLVQKVFPTCRCRDVHERHAEAHKQVKPSDENAPYDWSDDDMETEMLEDAATNNNTEDATTKRSAEPPTEHVRKTRLCPGHERSLPIEHTVMELDVKEEGIATLLCYLELHDGKWMENLSHVYHNCKIQCYGGPQQLQAIAKKCPPVAVAIAKARSQGKSFNTTNTVEFPVVEISDTMGWDSGPVKKELKLLQWNFNTGAAPSRRGLLVEFSDLAFHFCSLRDFSTELTTLKPVNSDHMSFNRGAAPSRTGLLVEFSDLAFHFRSLGDFSTEEMDEVLQFLHDRVQRQEKSELVSLSRLYHSLKSVSHKNHWMCADAIDMTKNDKLKAILNQYFDKQEGGEDPRDIHGEQTSEIADYSLGQVITDVRQFHSLYGQEHTFTGRAIARIFHGIASPCYPATTWGRVRRFWRSHLNVDFNELMKIATKELISMRQ